jgi:hypothetical protein
LPRALRRRLSACAALVVYLFGAAGLPLPVFGRKAAETPCHEQPASCGCCAAAQGGHCCGCCAATTEKPAGPPSEGGLRWASGQGVLTCRGLTTTLPAVEQAAPPPPEHPGRPDLLPVAWLSLPDDAAVLRPHPPPAPPPRPWAVR